MRIVPGHPNCHQAARPVTEQVVAVAPASDGDGLIFSDSSVIGTEQPTERGEHQRRVTVVAVEMTKIIVGISYRCSWAMPVALLQIGVEHEFEALGGEDAAGECASPGAL